MNYKHDEQMGIDAVGISKEDMAFYISFVQETIIELKKCSKSCEAIENVCKLDDKFLRACIYMLVTREIMDMTDPIQVH